MKITVPALKVMYRLIYKNNDRRLRAAPPWDKYRPILDEPYGEGSERVFDLFRAPDGIRRGILMIVVHGGYYVRGRHRDSYPFAVSFLEDGFDVAAVEYRLNGQTTGTDDQIDDVAEFLRFLFSSLDRFGLGDEKKFFLCGDSAGGHLALYTAEALGDERLGRDLSGVRLDGVLLNCPSYDYAAYRDVREMSRGMKKWILGEKYAEKGYLERLSPMEHIDSLSVPAFVSTSKHDFLREGVLRLIDDLGRYGKKYTVVDIDGGKRAGHVHNVIDPGLPESVRVNDAMMQFMLE